MTDKNKELQELQEIQEQIIKELVEVKLIFNTKFVVYMTVFNTVILSPLFSVVLYFSYKGIPSLRYLDLYYTDFLFGLSFISLFISFLAQVLSLFKDSIHTGEKYGKL